MAIFPELEVVEDVAVIEDRGTDFLYDFELEDFILKDGKLIEVTGDAAVVFWIEKTLRTEYEKSAVYENTGYGAQMRQFKGAVLPKEIAFDAIQDVIKSALLVHERISAITNFNFEQTNDMVDISFNVDLEPITEQLLGPESEDGYVRVSTLEKIKDFIGIKLVDSNRFLFKTSLGTQVYVG